MRTRKGNWPRWWTVLFFAIAMAWVEAALVFDLRTLVDRIEPYQKDPLPIIGALGPVELVREFATLVMLFTVGLLVGNNNWRTRLGYMLVAFGVWDIFYYIFLRVICGWPHSLLDWDILFLLPLPWWGPVLAPVLIATLMILWGTIASQFERSAPGRLSNWQVYLPSVIGGLLALYVFMADALRVVEQGVDVIRQVLPQEFSWPLFCLALALMAMSILLELRRIVWRPKHLPAICLQPDSPT